MSLVAVEVPSVDDVLAITAEVWSSYVAPDEPLVPVELDTFHTSWSGAVAVSGDWAGMIVVELTAPVASALTTRMFGEDAVLDDMADAVGELVNMVGGNIKALLPGESDLSVPVVAEGRVCPPPGSDAVVRVDLAWSAGPLRVAVHQLHVQPAGGLS